MITTSPGFAADLAAIRQHELLTEARRTRRVRALGAAIRRTGR